LHKEDEIFIRANPTRGITGRSLGIRMGKGKGLIDF
jgi:ribosomal protein L16/L10AE